MDKKIRAEIGKPIKKAETILKKAEKNTASIADHDEKFRDPVYKKAIKKGITRK